MTMVFDEVVAKVRTLPDDQQREAASLLALFLDQRRSDLHLTGEQVAEVERRLAEDEPSASDSEVQELFDRLAR